MVEVEYRIPEYNGKGHLHITVSIGEICKSVFLGRHKTSVTLHS